MTCRRNYLGLPWSFLIAPGCWPAFRSNLRSPLGCRSTRQNLFSDSNVRSITATYYVAIFMDMPTEIINTYIFLCGVVVRAMVWTRQNVSPTTIIWNEMNKWKWVYFQTFCTNGRAPRPSRLLSIRPTAIHGQIEKQKRARVESSPFCHYCWMLCL